MNPRLAVSILFILFAVTAFKPEANDAISKLKTLQHAWADTAPYPSRRHSAACERLTTAARQIHEVLALMRTK
jgi:hypothetical protein